MSTDFQTPSYVTFTGLDDTDSIPAIRRLSAKYPIEWGVLVDKEKRGIPLFPGKANLDGIRQSGVRLSAHICGEWAESIVQGKDISLDLSGFSRIQINHGFTGSTESQIANAQVFAAKRGVRAALQCQGAFPDDPRVDWLYDVSFGLGKSPTSFPDVNMTIPFCGISGGLGPDTVGRVVSSLKIAPNTPYWIDMESRVRTDGKFDVSKCERVCEVVFRGA